LKRFETGDGQTSDIDLLMDIANNIEGNTICALGDAAAWPVQSMIRRFRDEFEKRVSKTNISSPEPSDRNQRAEKTTPVSS
jgi:NADH-quinone oxidoreductase subunit F